MAEPTWYIFTHNLMSYNMIWIDTQLPDLPYIVTLGPRKCCLTESAGTLVTRSTWLHTSLRAGSLCTLGLHTPFLLVRALVWNSPRVTVGPPTLSSASHAIARRSGHSASVCGDPHLHHALGHGAPFYYGRHQETASSLSLLSLGVTWVSFFLFLSVDL